MTSTDNNWPANWFVRRVQETGSTNTDLFADATAGAPSYSVLMADNQTAGRGRLDRTWQAKAGENLLVSFLFRSEANILTSWPRIVALGAVMACQEIISLNSSVIAAEKKISLKWPNDLLLADRKLGGMLSVSDRQNEFIVVGIGINVGWSPPEAVSLREFFENNQPTPTQLLESLLRHITEIEKLSLVTQHQQYVSHLATLGQKVRIELTNNVVVIGHAQDVDADGRLIVAGADDNSTLHIIDTGDVVHLRNTDHG